MKKIIRSAVLIIFTILQFSCRKEIVDPPLPPPPNPENILPVADAGPDQTIKLPVTSVELNGSGTDADGSITGYEWAKISGAAVNIESYYHAKTVVNNLKPGVYKFQLTVYDNKYATSKDTVTVTVKKPLANAGADFQIRLPENSVTLYGNESESDGIITSYLWTKISGLSAIIVSPDQVQTAVTNLVEGFYEFQITVTDDLGNTGKDTVGVRVNPPCGLPYSDWFTLDTSFNSYDVYYDSTEFYSSHTLCPDETNYYAYDYVRLTFTKKIVAGVIEYKNLLNPAEISIVLPSEATPFLFDVNWEIDSYADSDTFFGQYFYNPYYNTYEGRVAFIQAVREVLSYQYRCLIISKTLYNSLNINWDNYLEVVAALNITS